MPGLRRCSTGKLSRDAARERDRERIIKELALREFGAGEEA
jgi:hypothetical protein